MTSKQERDYLAREAYRGHPLVVIVPNTDPAVRLFTACGDSEGDDPIFGHYPILAWLIDGSALEGVMTTPITIEGSADMAWDAWLVEIQRPEGTIWIEPMSQEFHTEAAARDGLRAILKAARRRPSGSAP